MKTLAKRVGAEVRQDDLDRSHRVGRPRDSDSDSGNAPRSRKSL